MIKNQSRRKPTGGLKTVNQKKQKYNKATQVVPTRLGERTVRKIRARGGETKHNLLTVDHANVVDPDDGEAEKLEIQDVVENPADPQYARRNIITKGAVIETEKGKARVTSRPGQDGTVNAVLI